MSDVPPPPPPPRGDDPDVPPVPPGFGQPPTSPPGPPTPPPPGGFPPQPPPPGGFGAPPPPGAYGAPPPGTPQPPGSQFGQPGYGFQPPAAPYQYGDGLPNRAILASPGKRILGSLIDSLILMVVTVPIVVVVVLASANTTTADRFGNTTSFDATVGTGTALLLSFAMLAIPALYHIAFVATKGQTPGAMLMKVRVVRLSDGQIPGWGPAAMRWVPNLVYLVPCCIGPLATLGLYVWGLVNLFSHERRQTPFDLAAKTVVIDVA